MQLRNDIKKLLEWLSIDYEIPTYDGLLVVLDNGEENGDSSDLRISLSKKNIFSVDDFAPEYENNKNSGLSWINMQCAGIYQSQLVVVIECSKSMISDHVSPVNFSGPYSVDLTGSPEWDFNKKFRFV